MEQMPKDLPLSVLKDHCSREMNNHLHGKLNDERYCLEIFRRALVEGDNYAWICLQEQFRENVLYWLRGHSKRREALQIETEQAYVDDTFKRLWQWGHNQKAELNALEGFHHMTGFHTLPGALKFLHGCLNSLIIDNLRAYTYRQYVQIPEESLSAPSTNEDNLMRKELWRLIKSILTDKRELRVIYLLYHEGLKPREILLLCPGEFADVKEIYRLTKNAMDRLKRRPDIFRWGISDGDG